MPGSTLPDDQVTLGEINPPADSNADDDEPAAVVIVHKPTRGEIADTVSSCLAYTAQLVDDGVDAGERASIESKIKTGDIEVSSRARVLADTDCALAIDIEGREHVANAVNAGVNDGIDYVVVDNLPTLGENIERIRGRVDRVVSAGAELHVTETATAIDERTADTVLDVLAGLDTAGIDLQRSQRITEAREWFDDGNRSTGGRAPLGFEWDDGEIVPVEKFDRVCGVLELVSAGEVSKRNAADRLDVAPRTIGRALDNPDRYGLDGEE